MITEQEQARLVRYLTANYHNTKMDNIVDWVIKALEETDIMAGSYSADEMHQRERAEKAEEEVEELKTKLLAAKVLLNECRKLKD